MLYVRTISPAGSLRLDFAKPCTPPCGKPSPSPGLALRGASDARSLASLIDKFDGLPSTASDATLPPPPPPPPRCPLCLPCLPCPYE